MTGGRVSSAIITRKQDFKGISLGPYLLKFQLADVPSRNLGPWRILKEETGYCSMKWPVSLQDVETRTAF